MLLYDVYYRGNSMDSNVPLPAPRPDIDHVTNTNWGHETMAPVYAEKLHHAILARARSEYRVAPYAQAPELVGNEDGQVSREDLATWRKLVSAHCDFYHEIEHAACALIWVEMGRPNMLAWPN